MSGLFASIIFPSLMKKMSLPRMGLFGIYAQVFMLGIMVLSRFIIPSLAGWDINEKNSTLYVFTAFLAMSRFGLWGFDLSVTQIMQEQVPVGVIGVVNGVQGSLCEMFQIIMYALTLWITNPADFWILVSAAISNVCLAALIYNLWYCQELPYGDTLGGGGLGNPDMAGIAPIELAMDEEDEALTFGSPAGGEIDMGARCAETPRGAAGIDESENDVEESQFIDGEGLTGPGVGPGDRVHDDL